MEVERRLDLNLQMQEIKEAAGDDPPSSVTAECEAGGSLGKGERPSRVCGKLTELGPE